MYPLKKFYFRKYSLFFALNVLHVFDSNSKGKAHIKKINVKTFLFSSSNKMKMQWSEKPSKQTALTCPKTATKI